MPVHNNAINGSEFTLMQLRSEPKSGHFSREPSKNLDQLDE